MSTESPVCHGCFLNNPILWVPTSNAPNYFTPNYDSSISPKSTFYPKSPHALTDAEKDVLLHLVKAWELFSNLDGKHPSDDQEFTQAIHVAQQKIGMRVARRVDTDIWKQSDEQGK